MSWSGIITVWKRLSSAVGAWLQKRWKWVLIGGALLTSFLLGLFSRGKQGQGDAAEQQRQRAEDEAKKKDDEIQRAAAEREKQVVEHADQERTQQVQEIASDTTLVQNDPDKVNQYLKDVGAEMRKP